MFVDDKLLIAKGDEPVYMLPGMANRHGLVAGATGTGKTVTVKTIIQSMSDAGIPTFVADVPMLSAEPRLTKGPGAFEPPVAMPFPTIT